MHVVLALLHYLATIVGADGFTQAMRLHGLGQHAVAPACCPREAGAGGGPQRCAPARATAVASAPTHPDSTAVAAGGVDVRGGTADARAASHAR